MMENKSTCKREGCDKPLAYQNAEYCGSACSALRREPKTPESEARLEAARAMLAEKKERAMSYEEIKAKYRKAHDEASGVKPS
jgi:hypothetical protein